MKTKGTEERISYPDIYFTVDNFEDVSHWIDLHRCPQRWTLNSDRDFVNYT